MRQHTEKHYRSKPNIFDLETISSENYSAHGGSSYKKAKATETKASEQYDDSDAWMEASNTEMRAKYEAEVKRWQDPNTTELERIAYGIGQYWRINDRINALEDYIKSGKAERDINYMGQTSQRANDVRKRLEILKERKKNNEYVNTNSVEKRYTINKIDLSTIQERDLELAHNLRVKQKNELETQVAVNPYPKQYQNNRDKSKLEKLEDFSNNNHIMNTIFSPFEYLASKIYSNLTRTAEYIENIGKTKLKPVPLYTPIKRKQNKEVKVEEPPQEMATPKNMDYSLQERRKERSWLKTAANTALRIAAGFGILFAGFASLSGAPASHSNNTNNKPLNIQKIVQSAKPETNLKRVSEIGDNSQQNSISYLPPIEYYNNFKENASTINSR